MYLEIQEGQEEWLRFLLFHSTRNDGTTPGQKASFNAWINQAWEMWRIFVLNLLYEIEKFAFLKRNHVNFCCINVKIDLRNTFFIEYAFRIRCHRRTLFLINLNFLLPFLHWLLKKRFSDVLKLLHYHRWSFLSQPMQKWF